MITLVRLHPPHYLMQAGKALERTRVQYDPVAHRVQALQAVCWILQRDAPYQAVNLVALRKQQFRQVRSVLAGYSRNQRFSAAHEISDFSPAANILGIIAFTGNRTPSSMILRLNFDFPDSRSVKMIGNS